MNSDARPLESIFFAALEIQDPEARAGYLAQACGQDDELRQRVLQMLAVQSQVDNFMEQPPAAYAGTVHLDKEILGAGLSAGFGPGEAVVIGSANHSVLKSLGRTMGEVPRVLLRDAKESGEDPIVRPRSKEIPADHADSRYQLAGEIARGGMGAIIKGRDIDLGRDLAIKVLLDAHKDKPEVVQRFIEEAQIGGQLQHPGIVPVYELGQFGDQRPFFSMKLVKGETLAGLLSARKNPAEDRAKFLGIFEQVCQTMAYAHSRGVIHRDLKPANIMVGAFGEVQVMDWGLAKVLAAGGIADEKKSLAKQADVSVIQTRRSLGSDSPGIVGSLGSQTQMGSVMGTPAYMSPEQALGEVDRLDERTDVFGLGAILCEILTGKPPYVAASGEQIFRLASRGKLEDCFARLDASVVDSELRQIVRDALTLEPDDRMRDAGVLAGRISGYLESVESRLRQAEVDRATETARAEEALKTAAQELVSRKEAQGRVVEELRRRRVTMALAASLLIGVISIGWFALHARDQQKRAEVARQNALLAQQAAETSQQSEILQREAADAARVSEAAQRMVAEDERDKATALSEALALEKQELSRQKEDQRRMLYISDMNRVQTAWQADNVSRVLELLNSHRPHPGQTDLRGFEWHYWNRQCHSDLRTVKLSESTSRWTSRWTVLNADGTRFAGTLPLSGGDERIKVWDAHTGVELCVLSFRRDPEFPNTFSMAFHPDGNRLAVSILRRNSIELMMWDIATGTSLFTIAEMKSDDPVREFATGSRELWISNDGARLAMEVARSDGEVPWQRLVKFWDAKTGQELAAFPLGRQQVSGLAISPDGLRIAFATSALATDGSAADASGVSIKILNVESLEDAVTIPLSGFASFRFSPDGARLFVSENTNALQTGDKENEGGVFDSASGEKLFSLPDTDRWIASRMSPDGNWLALVSAIRPRTVMLYNTANNREPVEIKGHSARISAVGFSSDGQRLFTAAENGQIKTWDVAEASRSEPSQLASTMQWSSFLTAVSCDGRRIATAPRLIASPTATSALSAEARKNVVTLRDDAGKVMYETPELDGPIHWLKFSPDGRRLAACAVNPNANVLTAAQFCVWDTASGAELLALRLPKEENSNRAPGAAFSPDGSRLAVVVNLGPQTARTSAIKVLDIDAKREVWESDKVKQPIAELISSPNGGLILGVPGSSNTRLAVWDAKDGRLLWNDQMNIGGPGFSADSEQIFGFKYGSQEIQLWDATSGLKQVSFRGPNFAQVYPDATRIALSPNGRHLSAGSRFGSGSIDAVICDLDRPERELLTLKGHSSQVQTLAFSPDSRRIVTSAGTIASTGEIKLWDAESGQELLTLPGAARNLAFDASGAVLIGEMGLDLIGDIRVRRWDAGRLAPHVEAEQIVESFTNPRGTDTLPLSSEILARIKADNTLPDETRAIAVTLLKGLPREKELKEAAYAIVALPDQRPEEYERALRYLEEACSSNPEDSESWSIRGLANYRLGHSTEALAVLARCQELQDAKKLSLSAEDFTIRAMAQHQLGRIDEALATLEQVRVSASRNELEWRKLLVEAETLLATPQAADQPELWIGRNFMPRILFAVENERGEWADPPLPYLVTKVVADRLWLGKNSIARSQVVPVDEAVRYYTNVIQADPRNVQAYNCRGNLSGFFLGNFDQAIADFSEAIRLSPASSTFVRNRGYVRLKHKKDLDKALIDFNEALRISPTDSSLHIDRGRVRLAQGELDDAFASFGKAIEHEPDSGLAYALRAYVWSAKGDREKMLQDFNQAIQRSPDDSSVWTLRAWLLATSPKADHLDGKQAVLDATQACKLTGWTDYNCLENLAAAYAETRDFPNAVKWQKQAIAIAPPAWRADFESRLKLYQDGQQYRDFPRTPAATDVISPPTDPLVK